MQIRFWKRNKTSLLDPAKKPVELTPEQVTLAQKLADDLTNASLFGKSISMTMLEEHERFFNDYCVDDETTNRYVMFLCKNDTVGINSHWIVNYLSAKNTPAPGARA